jgi:hypothetical protein
MLTGGDQVELLLQGGGEVVFDVAAEELLEEGGDQPALVLRHEALLLHPHIFAVAQHAEDRGVGRGPADAELLHPFHQRGLGEARRRLGEMLVGARGVDLGGGALGHGGQPAGVVALVAVGA